MIDIHFKNERVKIRQASAGPLIGACLSSPESPLPLGCRKGRCGTCVVRVLDGSSVHPPNEIELAYLSGHRIDDKSLRLGCQLQVNGNTVVETLRVNTTCFTSRGTRPISGELPDIGFSTNVLDNPADVIGSVELLSRHFKSIELELGDKAEDRILNASPDEYDQIISRIRTLREDRGIHLSIHAPYVGQNLASQDPEISTRSRERLRWAVSVAEDLGADKVTFHPGYHEGRKPQATMAPLLRALDRVVPEAIRKNIALCLENMGSERPDYIVYSAAEHETICRNSGARVALDVVHLASVTPEKRDFESELSRFLPLLGNVHFADMQVPKHVHLPLGEGSLNLVGILSKIRAGGYLGPAIVEEFGGPHSTQLFIDRAVQFRHQVSEENACRL